MGTGLSGNGSATAHRVQFYETDAEIVERLTSFVLDGLRDGAVITVADAGHRLKLEQALADRGVDVDEAQASGRLTMLDAAATLSRFYQDGALDADTFDQVIGGLIDRVAAAGAAVHVYGEMVALLWDAGEVNATLELEELWNRLGRTRNFDLLCGYPASVGSGGPEAVERICATHTHVEGDFAADRGRATRRFESELTTAAAVRRFVDTTLAEWDASHRIDDVRLVASELVTNAIRHVGSDITVTLTRPAGRLRVAVADGGTTCPSVVTADATAASGRGLRLVEAIAADWGCERRPDGKIVWADV